MHRNQSVNVHQFAMVPRADIPRSSFRMQTSHKTTFDSGWLIPVFVEEVLPGDSYKLKMTAFTRLSTPIVPIMDNLHLDSFFFFVPNRLTWTNWKKFMGEQISPGDSISYTVPQIVSKAGGHELNSIYDYMGLPTVGQVAGGATYSHSALPLRAYALIYDNWFRDENLCTPFNVTMGDGPDIYSWYALKRRGKRHDYFTSALPWVQKGTSVTLPMSGSAPVRTNVVDTITWAATPSALTWKRTATGAVPAATAPLGTTITTGGTVELAAGGAAGQALYPSNLYADLSGATGATINALRQSFQIQKLLERDARGGTRYTELIRSHFGVISPDARLQRPEYLGGGSTSISISPVAQTSATGLTGGTTPVGYLSAIGQGVAHGHGFTQSFTEHGYIIGLISVRADLSYQQGIRKMWSRSTRYDFYFPVFAMLGEQSILNKEIYCRGDANDSLVFGYQERWAEYRYNPSLITGLFRSTSAGTLDVWHLAQNFTALPTLNETFIADTPPVSRILATTPVTGKEFLCDCFFDIKAARPLPMYSVPGLIDHF